MAARTTTKSANAFRTISEAAEAVGAPQHVLRFWETKFAFITPVKRAGGRRFYRPEDIRILKAVKRLLHDKGLTLKGVERLFQEQGLEQLAAHGGDDVAPVRFGEGRPASMTDAADVQAVIRDALASVERARAMLDRVLAA